MRPEVQQVFGREHVDARINFRQQKYRRKLHETLHRALERCGFRRQHVRKVLDATQDGQSEMPWSAPVEELLREAILRLIAPPAPA